MNNSIVCFPKTKVPCSVKLHVRCPKMLNDSMLNCDNLPCLQFMIALQYANLLHNVLLHNASEAGRTGNEAAPREFKVHRELSMHSRVGHGSTMNVVRVTSLINCTPYNLKLTN